MTQGLVGRGALCRPVCRGDPGRRRKTSREKQKQKQLSQKQLYKKKKPRVGQKDLFTTVTTILLRKQQNNLTACFHKPFLFRARLCSTAFANCLPSTLFFTWGLALFLPTSGATSWLLCPTVVHPLATLGLLLASRFFCLGVPPCPPARASCAGGHCAAPADCCMKAKMASIYAD